MKKLVTAFALCAAMSAMAQTVESDNVVGYQTQPVAVGFTVFTPTFTAVGGANPTYSCIKGNFASGDNLQFFDAGGNVTDTVNWWNESDFAPVTGWYTSNLETYLGDTEIPIGVSAFLTAQVVDTTMTTSGQLDQAPVEIVCVQGFTVMGNCRPYAIKYSDLVCVNFASGDNLQFFDAGGNVTETVNWWNEADFAPVTGWYTSNLETYLGDTQLQAGQSFFLTSQNGDATITIPALY